MITMRKIKFQWEDESYKKLSKDEIEFLKQSNYIEQEMSNIALEDAMYAWDFAKNYEGRWNVNFILEIHRRLLRHIRPDIAGKIRNCDVYIGGQCKKLISKAKIKNQLADWIIDMYFRIEHFISPEDHAQFCHIKFENIHPFEDGNGRTGRILWQAQRLKFGLPLKIIWESEKDDYYQWFRN